MSNAAVDNSTTQDTLTFASMGLAQPLLGAIGALGFSTPTPDQAQAIPAAMLAGVWMVSSKTGSAENAAFLIPDAQRIDE